MLRSGKIVLAQTSKFEGPLINRKLKPPEPLTTKTTSCSSLPSTTSSTLDFPTTLSPANTQKQEPIGSSADSKRRKEAKRRAKVLQDFASDGLPIEEVLKASKAKRASLLRYQAAAAEFQLWAKEAKLDLSSIQKVDVVATSQFTLQFHENCRCPTDGSYLLFGWLMLEADEDKPDRILLARSHASLAGLKNRRPGSSRSGIP
eukprot:TRINITY_DN21613_c0_g1_i1.p1 TRINITY_DN21613_c0_g1~~TRINITY_DN21613_c0_g1_i1.p1  ORF type:complete len:203 (-),score=38.41 TRINITY_DN21613_c0_g1_i1:900-1508(-)